MGKHHQHSGPQNQQKKRSKKRINGAASSACCGGWWPCYAVASAFRGVGRCMYVGCFPIVRCLGLDDCRHHHHHHKHFHWERTSFAVICFLSIHIYVNIIVAKLSYKFQKIQNFSSLELIVRWICDLLAAPQE